MTPDRFRQIARLYREALDLQPQERAGFLKNNCGGDDELCREVESLFSAHEEARSFMAAPAIENSLITNTVTSAQQTMIGQVVSHYRIVEKIGEGGMGIVYRAEDTLLGRAVALKFVPPHLSGNQESRARLIREARTAAAFSHPNICTVFEIDETESGIPFIAMELVRGETLASTIAKHGQVPLKQLVDIAVQIAEALAEAHARGLVHRDLKPQNVMIGPDGRIKILDFGLAKFLQKTADRVDSVDQTASDEITGRERIIGTPSYMSPEQAVGATPYSSSDLFSFGVILYQMTTGKLPFEGSSVTATLAKILEAEPAPPSDIRSPLPSDLARIIKRCLQKNPKERFHDTRDLAIDLKALQKAVSFDSAVATGPKKSGSVETKPTQARRILALMSLAVVIIAAAVSAIRFADVTPGPRVAPTRRQVTFTGHSSLPSLSPDGQFVAYADNTQLPARLMVQDLSGGSLPVEIYQATYLVEARWSPDGSKLLVGGEQDGVVVGGIIPRLGGKLQKVTLYPYWSWSPDGTRYAGMRQPSSDISLIDIVTGNISRLPLSRTDVVFWVGLDWSPTGSLFALASTDEKNQGTIWTIRSDGTRQQKVYQSERPLLSPRWSPDGSAIYFLAGSRSSGLDELLVSDELWKVPISPSSGMKDGEPVLVMSGLQARESFSIARDGRRIAIAGTAAQSNLMLVEMTETGEIRTRALTQGTAVTDAPSISPDGSQVAFSRGDTRTSNIFAIPTQGGEPRQLTFLNSISTGPVWSPDGTQIAFGSLEGGSPSLWLVPSTGGQSKKVADTTLGTFSVAWAPSSRIAFQLPHNRNFALLDPALGERNLLIDDDSRGWAFDPRFSPDAREVAFLWSRSRGPDLWMISLIDSSLGRATQLSGRRRISLRQTIDVAAYRKHQIQVRAAIKANVSGTDSAGCFAFLLKEDKIGRWLSDLPNALTGSSSEWTTCVIEGVVDVDAANVVFGVFLEEAGTVWMDDFKLEFRDDSNQWQPIPIINPSFEEGQQTGLAGWSIEPEGQSVTTVSDSYRGKTAALIENRPRFRLSQGTFAPIGWSRDGKQVYAMDIDSRRVVTIPVSGGPAEALFDLPWSRDTVVKWAATMTPDARRFVFSVGQSQEDTWIIDNFDPDSP